MTSSGAPPGDGAGHALYTEYVLKKNRPFGTVGGKWRYAERTPRDINSSGSSVALLALGYCSSSQLAVADPRFVTEPPNTSMPAATKIQPFKCVGHG